MAQDKFDVGGMTCAACQAHVDRAVSKLDGVQSVAVNLLAGSMMVDYDPAQVTSDDICTAVDRAGYSASPISTGTDAVQSGSAQARSGAAHMESPTKKLEAAASAMRTRLIVSIIFLIPLFYIGMGHMLGWPLPGVFTDHAHSMTLALTELVLLIPIVYVNDAYFINGFKSLAHGAPTMDALIAVGATASVAWSFYAMFIMADQLAAGQIHEAMMTSMGNLYFESAGTILSLVTVGKYLETRSKSKTGGAIEALIDLAPKSATVVAEDGTETTVPAEHAAAIYVNEQPAFRVVCTPALLPQLALGRLLTEGWIASADEVEQIAVCAEGAKVQVYLRHPLPTRRAAAQEVASCCTDNIALGSPVEQQPLRPVPGLALQPEWVQTLTAAMHAGLPLYRATRAVHSCFVLHKGKIVFACEDLGRHNALDKAVGCAVLAGLPLAECVLYTSGRVPLDMVRKAIRAGVPVLVSKSMPTVQSAELAAEYGLQLVCGRKFPKV